MYININELKPHPRNSEFFDDMTGESWREFLTSIRESNGPVEPIVVTPDHIIVSGHQRVRACRELGIDEVECKVVELESDDDVLRVLIETNIRQRGIGNPNPVKFGRCIRELERIYGIRNGGDRKSDGHNVVLKSQTDLADELGITQKQLQRYKSLTDLIPELQDAVMSGQITPTTAMGFVKRLSPEEQHKLAEQIAGQEKVSGAEVEAQIKAIKDENAKLRQQATAAEKDLQAMRRQYDDLTERWKSAESKISDMKRPENERSEKIKNSALFFCAGVANFIKDYGGYIWLTEEINNMEPSEREGYIRAIEAVDAWVKQMKENIYE